jgi:hypothetical protein
VNNGHEISFLVDDEIKSGRMIRQGNLSAALDNPLAQGEVFSPEADEKRDERERIRMRRNTE